ncbi:DUF1617 family protein [Enterococcus pallens]|uniref:Phage protein n=1 Tax=Enterococcus pallens ATCC BAA-351 TaxID=1158607 RepID=R2SPX6_9ENTE|nr:DUF1617 family protein [Enterococcus pallens]EOH94851.1 hypothetical protein UAU_01773 [Enterococcus pallens ATCC BAA-351]EOU14830.1 hypothetical protein I588_04480 [Enterococcus pallens ATCC BAA-351]OJG76207.1 hypothetical protein RV10_GL004114 [Enterococcus pallens]
MELRLKNIELGPAINFLQNLSLIGRDSRSRSKLVKLIAKAFEEYSADEKSLMKEYNLLDENGYVLDEQKRNPRDAVMFKKEQEILSNDIVVIEGGMFADNLKEIPRILNEYESELSGQDAEIYDRLLDEFEENMQDEAEE